VALTTVTVQPNSAVQLGIWGFVNSSNAWQAVSDGSDATYVQLNAGLCRLDNQVLRFGFPAIPIPTGAQIYSVGLRRRIQAVPQGSQVPICLHWFRCLVGEISVIGQALQVFKTPFQSNCPTNPHVTTWVTESVFTATLGPDGASWTLASNLASGAFFYDVGRGDSFLFSPLRISEIYLDVTYQQASAITVNGLRALSLTRSPPSPGTYFSADSQPQQAYDVAVYTQSQVTAQVLFRL
jgi:hypothetical protein